MICKSFICTHKCIHDVFVGVRVIHRFFLNSKIDSPGCVYPFLSTSSYIYQSNNLTAVQKSQGCVAKGKATAMATTATTSTVTTTLDKVKQKRNA